MISFDLTEYAFSRAKWQWGISVSKLKQLGFKDFMSWVIVNFVDLLSIFGGTVGESKITDSLNIVLMYDGIFVLWQTSIYFKFS